MTVSDVAILFLAHNGVKHPQVWKDWRKQCTYKKQLHFFVHSNIEGSFEQSHRIHNFVPDTQWANKSLVIAYQNSVQEILQNKAIKTIYLISGFDVPVKKADFLFHPRWQNVSRFCRCSNKLVEDYDAKILPFSKATFQGHVQWHCLSRKHAEIVAKFDYSVFDQIQKIHDDFIIETNSDEKTRDLVPDEYYVLTSLKASRVSLSSDIINDCITEFYHTTFGDPSPILWTDLNTKRTVAVDEHNSRKLSLNHALQEAYEDKTTIFFRKVDGLVDMHAWLEFLQS